MEMITVSKSELRGILRDEVRKAMADYHSKITGNDWQNMPNHITRKQAAEILNISTDTIDRHTRPAILEAIKDTEAELEKLLISSNANQVSEFLNDALSIEPGTITTTESQISYLESLLKNMGPDDPKKNALYALLVYLQDQLKVLQQQAELTRQSFKSDAPIGPGLVDDGTDAFQKDLDEKLKLNQENLSLIKQAAIDNATQIASAVFDIRKQEREQELQQQLSELENKKNIELNSKNITESQKALIEKKYAKQEAELRRRAFEAEKQASISKAFIDFAAAQVALLANGILPLTKAGTPNPVYFISLGQMASTLGLQLTSIKKQKPPAFRKGTKYGPGQVSLVGEEGPELKMVERGAKVYTAKQTNRIMGVLSAYPGIADDIINNKMPKPIDTSIMKNEKGVSIDYDKIGKSVAENLKIEQTSVNFNADSKGFELHLKKGRNTQNVRGRKR